MDPLKMYINLLKMVICHETMFVNTRVGIFLKGVLLKTYPLVEV